MHHNRPTAITRVALSEVERVAPERAEGYLEEVMAASELEDGYLLVPDAEYDRLLKKYSGKVRPCGVGCQLKRLLASMWVVSTESCLCNQHAAIMDAWGPDVCLQRINEIVGWMREEAHVRGLIFSDIAAGQLVRIACRRARKNAQKVAAERT